MIPFTRPIARSAALLLLVAPALAVGPDITHQDLLDAAHYGPVNGIHAYAWGSGTCNTGDASLSWTQGGSPALAMNAYRLSNGQLYQIGIGFCKHACCAGNGSGCGPTCSTTGFGLHAGCRDVYGAGFNGGQSHLGPRTGIDPYLGNFTTIPTLTGDAIFRRVQIDQRLMDAGITDALYFAEGVYVCMEEEPAQQLNNATYRLMTVANTGAAPTYVWTPAAGSASQVGRPAIYAWRDHGLGLNRPDTSVQIVPVDVPGEGRFFVAGRVKNAGAGIWQYDYAVYNLNSNRCAGSITIGLPAAATLMTDSFHDIDYHSGELHDNTDWIRTRPGDTIAWAAPADFAHNPNGNALQWGTMSNFSFTTTAAPLEGGQPVGSVRIGLFRPGSPTSIVATGLPVPCVSAVDQPAPTTPACRGGTASLTSPGTLGSIGAAPVTYRWRRENPDHPGDFMMLTDGPAPWGGSPGSSPSMLSGANTATLIIHGTNKADAGPAGYSCVFTNSCGTVTSTSAVVAIRISDYNCDSNVTVQDVFDFLHDYFSNTTRADVDADGLVKLEDIFMFLTSYFTQT